MKFFTTSQIRQLDQYTIEQEPIASIDLMERAANALYGSFVGNFPYPAPVCILAGQGNNGGDALALARMLLKSGQKVRVYLIHSGLLSPDCETNRQRLSSAYPDSLTEFTDKFVAPDRTDETIIVDGLFGSGLSRPIKGIFADAVEWINQTGNRVVSIDIPSGLAGEENKLTESSVIVEANLTLSLQFPKLAFFLAENARYVGNWKVLDIGIHPEAIEKVSSNLFYLEEDDIAYLLKKRHKFSNKGTYGHALVVAGSTGMAGASVLASKAALRSGAGLVTVHGPAANRIIVQTANPEVIFQSDITIDYISHIDSLEKYNAIAIGPGIGTQVETADMLNKFIFKSNVPCVFDADALNIISTQKELLQHLTKNSILTPHPKEFERLFGVCNSSYDRIRMAHRASKIYGVIIILKGAHTLIALPDGNLCFNSTGNSGMATAGSGDVLTGILVGLLAQGYKPEDAAKLGVFIHGQAGDLALTTETKESLIAGDIIERIGDSFRSIRENCH
ncbi:MAG: NAD(P)H-hydrate dehydratase [Bacteroidota bacterium]|nr:NAD(P)H-hydrate dehydratase [Bacteroidota bacterium]